MPCNTQRTFALSTCGQGLDLTWGIRLAELHVISNPWRCSTQPRGELYSTSFGGCLANPGVRHRVDVMPHLSRLLGRAAPVEYSIHGLRFQHPVRI